MNIPAWFSSSLLLLCGVLIGTIACAKWEDKDYYARHWVGLAIMFVFLSLGEAIALHEMMVVPGRRAFTLSGFLFYVWVIPAGALVIICAAAYAQFRFELSTDVRLPVLTAGVISVGGILWMEVIDGYYD